MTEFVVIDDDPINNTIFQKIIFLAYPEAVVHVFTSPMAGFHFIKAWQSAPETGEMVLFLDNEQYLPLVIYENFQNNLIQH